MPTPDIDAAARRVEKAAVRQMVQHRGARMGS